MLPEGVPGPWFELADSKGSMVSSRQLAANGPLLLFFFKVSCPVCQMAAPFVERLRTGGGLQVFGISQDDAKATTEFSRSTNITFPILLDESRRGYPVSNAYGISSVPSLFVIESDGMISTSFNGFSKQDFEELGRRAGAAPFGPGDRVPAFRAG